MFVVGDGNYWRFILLYMNDDKHFAAVGVLGFVLFRVQVALRSI